MYVRDLDDYYEEENSSRTYHNTLASTQPISESQYFVKNRPQYPGQHYKNNNRDFVSKKEKQSTYQTLIPPDRNNGALKSDQRSIQQPIYSQEFRGPEKQTKFLQQTNQDRSIKYKVTPSQHSQSKTLNQFSDSYPDGSSYYQNSTWNNSKTNEGKRHSNPDKKFYPQHKPHMNNFIDYTNQQEKQDLSDSYNQKNYSAQTPEHLQAQPPGTLIRVDQELKLELDQEQQRISTFCLPTLQTPGGYFLPDQSLQETAENKFVLVFYITLFNVPIRVKVRQNDNIDELAKFFVYSFLRNHINTETVSFLLMTPHRQNLLMKSLAFMIKQQKAALMLSDQNQSTEQFQISGALLEKEARGDQSNRAEAEPVNQSLNPGRPQNSSLSVNLNALDHSASDNKSQLVAESSLQQTQYNPQIQFQTSSPAFVPDLAHQQSFKLKQDK